MVDSIDTDEYFYRGDIYVFRMHVFMDYNYSTVAGRRQFKDLNLSSGTDRMEKKLIEVLQDQRHRRDNETGRLEYLSLNELLQSSKITAEVTRKHEIPWMKSS
jgi:hypothetical protein